MASLIFFLWELHPCGARRERPIGVPRPIYLRGLHDEVVDGVGHCKLGRNASRQEGKVSGSGVSTCMYSLSFYRSLWVPTVRFIRDVVTAYVCMEMPSTKAAVAELAVVTAALTPTNQLFLRGSHRSTDSKCCPQMGAVVTAALIFQRQSFIYIYIYI